MSFRSHAAQVLMQALANLKIDKPAHELQSLLELPKNEKLGDLAFPCFILAKELKSAPPKIASQLAEVIQSQINVSVFSSIAATGPYLNFTVDKTLLAQSLIPNILSGEFLKPRPSKSEKVMVEYSQPNTHKAFHVGHTRNVALGDALVRLYRWAGFEVIAANYIGDVGAHIAKCLWYFQNHFKGEIPKENRGEFLGDLYVKATEMLDFTTLTQAPHPGVITAKVVEHYPHPQNEKWQVVMVESSSEKHQVVCAGQGFQKNDIIAYAPVGVRFKGRLVGEVDKKGVISYGVMLSEKELGTSDNNSQMALFSNDTPIGAEVANLLKKPEAVLHQSSVVEEMNSRTAGVEKVLHDLEQGEPEITALWQKTKDWSMHEFYQIYDWLDAKFDHWFFESDVGDEGKNIVKQAYQDGVLIKDEGAIGADLSAFKLPFFLLLKSNGSGLYSTKDIALAERKFKEFHIDRSIYVVDDGQSLHFQQVFKTLELLGYKNAEKCTHLAYGKVERPDGKMSSRRGNVILFSQLKSQLLNKIKSEFLDKYKGEWSESEIEDAAHRISVATIKYGMLNQDNNKNIVFDLNEWTARTGNTGPYLMYAYTRTRSILKEAGPLTDLEKVKWSTLSHESAHGLLRTLEQFQSIAEKSALRFEPQALCIYLFSLSKDFNQFYQNCSVLHAENEELRQARLALVVATGLVIQKGLALLGIQTVERM